MATQKSTQAASDRAVENLLAEIASTAYLTEQHLRVSPGDIPELHEHEVEMLRHTVARLGWMADLALKRLGSLNTMRDGDAAAWMLTPLAVELLSEGAQS